MQCPNCAAALASEANFCPVCGTPTVAAVPPASTAQPAADNVVYLQPNPAGHTATPALAPGAVPPSVTLSGQPTHLHAAPKPPTDAVAQQPQRDPTGSSPLPVPPTGSGRRRN